MNIRTTNVKCDALECETSGNQTWHIQHVLHIDYNIHNQVWRTGHKLVPRTCLVRNGCGFRSSCEFAGILFTVLQRFVVSAAQKCAYYSDEHTSTLVAKD